MAVVKRSVSINQELWDELSKLAEPGEISSVINDALEHHLRLLAGKRGVEEYESDFGRLTEEDLSEADRILKGLQVPGARVTAKTRKQNRPA